MLQLGKYATYEQDKTFCTFLNLPTILVHRFLHFGGIKKSNSIVHKFLNVILKLIENPK